MNDPALSPETPPTGTSPGPSGREPAPRGRVLRLLAVAAAIVVACVALCGAAAVSMWRSEAGTRWLLAHVPGITAVDVQGSFGSGDLRIGSLRAAESRVVVDIASLHIGGLALHWRPDAGAWLGVSFDVLEADTVGVRIAPSPTPAPGAASKAPTSLRSPVALGVATLRIGTLTVGDAAPLHDVRAGLAVGADAGGLHRVDRLSFGWERVLATGSATLRTDAPMRLDVSLNAHDSANPATASALPHWAATATLRGPLAGFDAVANLQGAPLPGRAAPKALANARITPFATLPVSEVLLETTELDLRALSANAPATRLQGSLRVATTKPAALDADLRNLAPAALSDGGLPFSVLTARLETPWNGEFIAIPALRLVLADAKGPGGELRAQGRWEGDKAQIQLDLDQVQPARIDAHVGAWRVAGPLRAELDHLPAPASSWGAAPRLLAGWNAHLTGRLTGSAPPLSSDAKALAPPPMALQLDASLRADALQLKRFDLQAGAASVSAQGAASRGANDRWQGDARAQWTQLDPGTWWQLAESGPLRDGRNILNGTLTLRLADAPATWQGLAALRGQVGVTLADSQLAGLPLQGNASLDATAAPWKLAAELHSATNQARVDGVVTPERAGAEATALLVDRLHLNVDAPSLAMFARLAPRTGEPRGNAERADGASAGSGAPSTAATTAAGAARATATLAPTSIPGQLIAKAATQVATGGKTSDPRALASALAASTATTVAPAPASAPDATSAPSSSAPAVPVVMPAGWPTRGSAHVDVEITGARFVIGAAPPQRAAPSTPMKFTTRGDLEDWAGPSMKLARLQWSGQGSTDPQAPLEATLSLVGGQYGVVRVEHADARLSGTLANHRLQLQAEAPVSPPLWLAHMADIGKANATRLDVALQGRWQPEATDAPAWQGQLAQFDLRATDLPASVPAAAAASVSPAPATTVANPAWIHLQPIALSLSRDAAGAWQTLRVGAGQAQFAGLAMAWQPSFWTAPAGPAASAHWGFDATLAPFSVARLLARAQPDLGWHGDLQMTAQLHAAFDGRWHVDGRVARTSGDLSVSDLVQDINGTKQALGLTTALLQVKAEGAAWQASADVAGTRLGELTGRWTAEAPSPASLPTAGSPLQGNVKAHVDDLNVWGAWLPSGWRLGGELRTDLALAGRWGAPRLTGAVTAQRLAIRNALEGVYGHDGDVAIRLTGDQAQIEHFSLRGGNGELSVTGTASLGALPLARLHLQATQFQLLGRIDRKVVASGNVDIQLGEDALRVAGKLGIDEGLFDLSKGNAPTLDSDVEVLDGSTPAPDADPVATPVVTKTGRATTIALAVDLGDKLALRGRGIDTRLQGALQISAPNGQLAVRGNVHTEGGQYVAYGQKLQVARGEIFFTGPVNDPRLDILATRPNLDIVVGVAITGTALAPHVKLTSQPEMSDSDKLSWLMLGRAPENLGGADTALLQQAAIALLAGEDEAPTDQLLKRLGLTDFAVNQKTEANDVRQTVVSLGRQISKRVYVGYEHGVTGATSNWQLIYRIAQRLTVRLQSGRDSSVQAGSAQDNSVDVIYTWRWN